MTLAFIFLAGYILRGVQERVSDYRRSKQLRTMSAPVRDPAQLSLL